jgi:hypothetical protein
VVNGCRWVLDGVLVVELRVRDSDMMGEAESGTGVSEQVEGVLEGQKKRVVKGIRTGEGGEKEGWRWRGNLVQGQGRARLRGRT